MNPMDIRRGIIAGVDRVVNNLKVTSKVISTKEEIAQVLTRHFICYLFVFSVAKRLFNRVFLYQVATISANGEKAVGDMIANAMERVGKTGLITVQTGTTMEDELEVVEGMSFDRGFISPYFISDPKTQKCELDNPYILIFDKKISQLAKILPILELVLKENRALLIVAEDVDSACLYLFSANGKPVTNHILRHYFSR